MRAEAAACAAADDDVKRALLAMAHDEERHAQLAWDIVAWGERV